MLCLQVYAPGYFVFKLIIVLFQNLDCLCIGDTCKIGLCYMMQTVEQSLINEIIEEVHLLRRMLQYVIDNIFQHCLCQIHVILQICKCHLRLNHPELCGMTRRVGILRTECRAECIDVLECHRIRLSIELTANGQIRRLSKEILTVIDGTVLIFRYLIQIHRCHLEHLTGAFTVTAGNQGCMHIYKILLLEKFMNRICDQ